MGIGCLDLFAGFFVFQKSGVIALVEIQFALFQFQHTVADRFQKIPIVGHQQQGRFLVAKPVLQPFDGVQIQVVGGFVQQNQVGFGDHHGGQGNPLALTTRKGGHVLAEVRNFQFP